MFLQKAPDQKRRKPKGRGCGRGRRGVPGALLHQRPVVCSPVRPTPRGSRGAALFLRPGARARSRRRGRRADSSRTFVWGRGGSGVPWAVLWAPAPPHAAPARAEASSQGRRRGGRGATPAGPRGRPRSSRCSWTRRSAGRTPRWTLRTSRRAAAARPGPAPAPPPAPPSPQCLGCSAARTWAAQAPGGAALAEERGQVAGRQPALAAGAHVPHEPARGAVRVR